MVKTAYRNFQHWDSWLTHSLGKSLLDTEEHFLSKWLKGKQGKHSLLLGVPEQLPLLNIENGSYHFNWLLTPLFHHKKSINTIEAGFHELPIRSGSVDLVLMPHILEFVDNPHHALAESCRLVKPEGYMVIIGFNPYSLWGVKQYLQKAKSIPWSGHFLPVHKVKEWLTLSDFKIVQQSMLFFRPPIEYSQVLDKLKLLEYLGSLLYRPWGGVYVVVAQAKVTPLTPIRLYWKQQLSSLPISTTMSGPTIRNPSS